MGTVLFLIAFFGIGALFIPKSELDELAWKEYEEDER